MWGTNLTNVLINFGMCNKSKNSIANQPNTVFRRYFVSLDKHFAIRELSLGISLAHGRLYISEQSLTTKSYCIVHLYIVHHYLSQIRRGELLYYWYCLSLWDEMTLKRCHKLFSGLPSCFCCLATFFWGVHVWFWNFLSVKFYSQRVADVWKFILFLMRNVYLSQCTKTISHRPLPQYRFLSLFSKVQFCRL